MCFRALERNPSEAYKGNLYVANRKGLSMRPGNQANGNSILIKPSQGTRFRIYSDSAHDYGSCSNIPDNVCKQKLGSKTKQ